MMAQFKLTRSIERCVCCIECVRVCPQSRPGSAFPVIVEAKKAGDPPEVVNSDNCIQCLQCVDFCRASALTFENYYEVKMVHNDPSLVREVGKII